MFASFNGRLASMLRAGVVTVAVGLMVSGCAGFRGVQREVTADDLDRGVCPSAADYTTLGAKSDPDARKAFRNSLIGTCVHAADLKFADFIAALRIESTSVKLGTTLATLTMGGLGAVGNGSKVFSAATAGLAGASAAVDKDLYFDQTMPALVSAMNINRNQVLAKIEDSEKLAEGDYSLADAAHDIWAYQNASNIDMAIKQLTSVASQVEAKSAALVNNYRVGVVDDDTEARAEKLIAYVDGLEKDGNLATLNSIATKLNIPTNSDPAKIKKLHNDIVYYGINPRSTNKSDMDKLASDLSSITGPGF